MKHLPTIILILLSVMTESCSYRKELINNLDVSPSAELMASVSFQDVHTKVFVPRCIACHGNSGGTNLETYSEARAKLEQIRQTAVVQRTMPKAPFPTLTAEEFNILAAWVYAGGPEFAGNTPTPPATPPETLQPNFPSIQKHILVPKCISCHSTGGPVARIPLTDLQEILDSPLELVIPGNPEESGLIMVLQEGARKAMPPPSSGITRLTEQDRKVLEDWIRNGANE